MIAPVAPPGGQRELGRDALLEVADRILGPQGREAALTLLVGGDPKFRSGEVDVFEIEGSLWLQLTSF